jgi:Ni/Co efflux regulator RcnB
MNSKFKRMALPGLVMGLALGLSVPAVSFAQDDHHDRGGQGSGSHGNGGGDHGGHGGGAQPQPRSGGGGGDRGNFVGARTSTGAAVSPQPHGDAGVQARVGAGEQPGYHGQDRSSQDRGSQDRGGQDRGSYRGNDTHGGGDRYRGNDRGGDYRGGGRDDRGGGGHFDWHGDAHFNVPDQYYGRPWGRGEYLPRFFFSYRVYDPDYYDLPYPPYGCAWMFVGEDAVLVDLDTGEVLDVVYGVF